MREPRTGEGALTAAVGAAVLVAMLAFLPVVQGAMWWFQSLVLISVALAAAAVGRRIGLPAAAAALVGLTTVPLVAAFLASGSGVPGGAANAVVDAFGTAFRQIYVDSVPAQGTRELALLLACGAAAVAVVTDFVAVGLRAPVAGVLLVVAVAIVPGKAFATGTNALLLVALAAGALGVIAADRRRRGRAPRLAGLAAGGAVAVVVALLAQVVLPTPFASQAQIAGAPLIDAGANPLLRLGQDLRRGATTPVLSYESKGNAPVYLRLAVLEDFRGDTWAPNRADGQALGAAAAPRAAGTGFASDAGTRTTRITPASPTAIGDRLPVPYPAVSVVGVTAGFQWERRGLTLARTGAGEVGGYVVTAEDDAVSPGALRAASVSAPAGDDDSLRLPPDVPSIIRTTANRWTRDATTPYDAALAIQNQLRNGVFSYDESTPAEQGYDGDGLGVIATFLKVKAGYCIHYASTMAVMARLEGIPSRIVVGYQPGETRTGSRDRLVTSDDLHAWPELYFDGIGWVRFEPTPGRGAVPAYAPLPSARATTGPTSAASREATPAPSAAASDPAAAARSTDPVAVAGTTVRAIGVVLAVVLLLALPGLVRRARRRRRLARLGREGPAVAWRELADTVVDLGLPSPRGRSPRGLQEALAGPTGARVAGPLARLRVEYERQAYSPAAGRADPEDVRRVLDALRQEAPPARRLLAAVAPRSLVASIGAPRLAFRWSPPGNG